MGPWVGPWWRSAAGSSTMPSAVVDTTAGPWIASTDRRLRDAYRTAASARCDNAIRRTREYVIVSDFTRPPHSLAVDEVLDHLEVDPGNGLDSDHVDHRRRTHGPNTFRVSERRNVIEIVARQFASVVLLVLAAAAAVALVLGHRTEAIAIIAVLLVNTVIGFVSEWRAVRTMEGLQQLEQPEASVRRDGSDRTVAAAELVPGDLVLLGAGDVVPADLRIIEADRLRVAEAPLTGESVPVVKRTDPVDADAPLAERSNMLYKGTSVVEGSAAGVVTATGMDTELGRISELAATASSASTPLQQNLDRLGRRLAWITIAVAASVAAAGLLAGQPTALMLETAIALGVAAIPEGLPIVATIALARGMFLMARRNAVVNRLTAVETLGATRVVFSDKTGTLTENRMRLVRLVTDQEDVVRTPDGGWPDDELTRRALELGVLCNNASIEDGGRGDPTEIALLEAGREVGLERAALLEKRPELREESFDPDVMMMATFHRSTDGIEVAVKGAPSAVIGACRRIATAADSSRELDDAGRRRWLDLNETLAGEGLRLLALADRRVDTDRAEPFRDLRLIGLAGLVDPPRDGVSEAVERCQAAGIRVLMVTGDQPGTALAVARQIGLEVSGGDADVIHGGGLDERIADDPARVTSGAVFARVSPEQKLRLVELFQDAGEIVAMTGDGVNDAPALKQADIGIAMGRRGTDAARQVADMVLRDDALSSVVAAVRQGRTIFGNIRRSVMFMLCTNVAEVLAVAAASVAGLPLPLRPLQILYLNVLTDVLPALALGVGPGAAEVMDRPPRPADEPVLTRRHWTAIGSWSAIISACVLGGLLVALMVLGTDRTTAVTVSFLTLGFAKLWFVFNLADRGAPVLDNQVVRNPWIWGAIGVCAALLLLAVYLPPLAAVLGTARPGARGWVVVIGLSLVPLVIGGSIRALRRRPV